jgi:hypothetical protein
MRTLFLGNFAAALASRILAKVKTPLETANCRRSVVAGNLARFARGEALENVVFQT